MALTLLTVAGLVARLTPARDGACSSATPGDGPPLPSRRHRGSHPRHRPTRLAGAVHFYLLVARRPTTHDRHNTDDRHEPAAEHTIGELAPPPGTGTDDDVTDAAVAEFSAEDCSRWS